MVHRALRRLATAHATPRAKASLRAKSLAPRLGPRTVQAVAQFAEVSTTFDALLAERSSLGRIDACYGELCACAADLVRAVLDDPGASRSLDAELSRARAAYVRGERFVGGDAEQDVAFAERVLIDVR